MAKCPFPDKAKLSKRGARRALRSIQRHKKDGGGRLHVYPCGDHWHVGHIARESWRDGHR